jgi:hypothetical protein
MALEMGAAALDITPRTPNHLAGYGSRNHPHEKVHDPTKLRALYARGREGREAVLISADLLWFGLPAAERIRAALRAELGLDSSRVLLAGTHTHSAPVTDGEKADAEWLGALEACALAATALAKTRLGPVRLRLGRAPCAIGMNRRERKPGGSIVLGRNPEGVADRELIVIAADDARGKPVARLMSFGCHGVVLGPGNYQLSGDWPGDAAAEIEKKLGAPALFLNGGPGNVDPRIRVQNEFGPVREVAGEFLKSVAAASRRLKPLADDDRVEGVEWTVRLPRKLRDVEDGKGRTRLVTLRGLRFGPLRIVGYPGEMFAETAMAVKRAAPASATLVCSYADGGDCGYVPVREAYDDGGYEVHVTPYAEGAEALLLKGLLDALAKLSRP